jgi:photosystem II stability/assembly factor-like uncharacterized protein
MKPLQLLCRAAAAMLVPAACSGAAPVADPLERPALISRRADAAFLLDIARAGKRLVAVGERGTVLLSDDDGRSWRQARQVPVAVTLTRVTFPSPNAGWAVGHAGVVLASDDTGATWSRRLDGRHAAAAALAAAQAALAREPNAANRHALKEAERLVADGPDKPFLDLHFTTPQRGFVVGAYGIIFRTEDGGRTWHPWMSRLDNPNGYHLNAIAAVDEVLYIAGEHGLMLRSTDGGEHFFSLKLPYEGSFFTVAPNNGKVVVGGLRGNAFVSADQGKSWKRLGVAVPVTLAHVAPLSGGGLLFTNQAGQALRDSGEGVRPLRLPPLPPLTAAVEAADGAIVAATYRGPRRLPSP